MARNNSQTEETKNEAPTATAAAQDERIKMIKDPDSGQPIRRADYIRKCWVEKQMSRGAIARHLTELAQAQDPNAKKVPYQTVFAVIKKGTPGGPVAPQPTEAAQA